MKDKFIAEIEGVVKNGRVEVPWKVAKELLGPNASHKLYFVVEHSGIQSERSAILYVSKPETVQIELEIDPKDASSCDDIYIV